MKIELMVNKSGLPKNGFTKLDNEFTRRIHALWPEAEIRLRKGNNNLTVLRASKDEKKIIGKLLEEMFDEADEWLYE